MIDALGTAVSGLFKASQKAESAASNIANVTTPRDDGVIVDLSAEAVNLLLAETEYKANVAVIRASEELSDELLDVLDD